jgi:cyclic-di-GMP phosphodiesterase TipF (flagellum assembly factor)
MTNLPNLIRAGAPVQSLVYMFIALAGLCVGAAAYFGFTFTPIESLVVALAFVGVAVILLERTLRRRAEARLERAIEDLSRLLSTDAQAGAVLGQRINSLIDVEPGKRLDSVEADISVLGTVVRQVAEAVADLEEARKLQARREEAAAALAVRHATGWTPLTARGPIETFVAELVPTAPQSPIVPPEPEPVIPLETLKLALDEGRLVFHLQPILTLPQRRTYGYDLVPRLALEEGEFADPPDFMPRRGGEGVIRRIERLALEEAVMLVRRARTSGQPAIFHVPLSRATLAEMSAVEKVVALLEANRAITDNIVMLLADAQWDALSATERLALTSFTKKGVGVSLGEVRSLRRDFAELVGDGVRSVRVNGPKFIAAPENFTDFHTSDVNGYVKRFEIDLIATGVDTEEQILALLDDGLGLAQGPRIGAPGPARADLTADRPAEKTPRRVEA